MAAKAWVARKDGAYSQEAKARRLVARQQPPMGDRRTKRLRTRSAQERRAIEEGR